MKIFLIIGALIFLAARFIWDARAAAAAVWAVAVGALFWWIGNMKPSTWQTTSRDLTPDVGF